MSLVSRSEGPFSTEHYDSVFISVIPKFPKVADRLEKTADINSLVDRRASDINSYCAHTNNGSFTSRPVDFVSMPTI